MKTFVNKIWGVDKVWPAVIFLLGACYLPNRVSDQNISFIYSDQHPNLEPQLSVFHFSSDSSRVYVQISKKGLLYKTEGEKLKAKLRVDIKLYHSDVSRSVLDTVSVVLAVAEEKEDESFALFSFDLKCTEGSHYFLESDLFDMHRGKGSKAFLSVDKTSVNTAQHFLVRDVLSGRVIVRRSVAKNQKLKINFHTEPQLLHVNYHNKSYFLAPPPFAQEQNELIGFNPDSSFTVFSSDTVSFLKKGFYHIITDTQQKQGLTLFVFDEDYPLMTSPERLILPLRYLMGENEYGELASSLDKKNLLDNFWLEAAGGNRDRAKMLIQSYYSRVHEANKFFTSYKEGWKTDRGMIYIVYGNPSSVYREGKSENWVYQRPYAPHSLIFRFTKADNIFSDNDYLLDRSPEYRMSWYNEVEMWRRGVLR